MPVYGSREWLDEVQRRLNADPAMQAQAKNLDAAFQYVIQAEPDAGFPETLEVGWSVEGGQVTEVWEGSRPADFVFVGAYSVFKAVNTGAASAMDVMVKGQLQVQGDQGELMANMAALGAMQDVLEGMHRDGATEWPA